MKFTFKKNVPIGQFRSFEKFSTDIKLNGKIVGLINEGDGFNNWSVRLRLKDESALGWKWARLKARFESEAKAREFLNENFETLLNKKLAPEENSL